MKMELNKIQILEYQRNEPPYLMIDHVTEVIPGVSAKGYKKLTTNEWFFEVHWKGEPNMPGILQLESLTQMAALSILTLPKNKGKTMYLVSADKIRFFKKVLPDQTLHIETNIDSYKRGIAKCYGQGKVNNEICCKAQFNLILPSEIEKYNLK